jgi:3-dehydroquinate dehydratase-2
MKNILVIHGPNLNLLGTREPEVYGHTTLDDINQSLKKQANTAKCTLNTFQSNHEGELIETIQLAPTHKITHIIINPGAFTHTSIAMRDAILAVNIPFIEVHLSNIFKRETFRQHSYFSDIAQGVISGLGLSSYKLALDAIINL